MFQLNWTSHKKLLAIALPMILSNITVPLLGLVDTAVIGHLTAAYFLGGVAIGSTICHFIFSLAGFLRMATTGVTAQAFGAKSHHDQAQALIHSILIALSLGLMIILIHPLIAHYAFPLAGGSPEVQYYGQVYFNIRIIAAPATLINLVLLGWMLGMQNAKGPMWHLILINCLNIGLDLLLVFGFQLDVVGVAWASVIADHCGVLIGGYFVYRISQQHLIQFDLQSLKIWQHWSVIQPLLLINRDIFFRTLCLGLCFAFMSFQGAKLGDDIIAANVILLNFLMLVSFALDGIAYAVEALVGKAYGDQDHSKLKQSIQDAAIWTLICGICFSLIFIGWGDWLIGWMTDINSVQQTASQYLPWMMILPLICVWCFLLDGICIGITAARAMRNSTFFAALLGFLLPWWIAHHGLGLANHSLWLAMCGFMTLRSILLYHQLTLHPTLGYLFKTQQHSAT